MKTYIVMIATKRRIERFTPIARTMDEAIEVSIAKFQKYSLEEMISISAVIKEQ